MSEKYYTPEIEEFHVGFEYEWKDDMGNSLWSEAIIKDGTQIDDIHADRGDGERQYELRVKHLDREDIESCGFSLDQCTKKDGCEFYKGTIMDNNEWNLSIGGRYREDFQVDIQRVHLNSNDNGLRFSGTIKNKSELKRVLKQIGAI